MSGTVTPEKGTHAGSVRAVAAARSFLYPPQLYADPVAAALLAIQGRLCIT